MVGTNLTNCRFIILYDLSEHIGGGIWAFHTIVHFQMSKH